MNFKEYLVENNLSNTFENYVCYKEDYIKETIKDGIDYMAKAAFVGLSTVAGTMLGSLMPMKSPTGKAIVGGMTLFLFAVLASDFALKKIKQYFNKKNPTEVAEAENISKKLSKKPSINELLVNVTSADRLKYANILNRGDENEIEAAKKEIEEKVAKAQRNQN